MSNKERYRVICSERPDLPVFMQHWWLDTVCSDWDVSVIETDGAITGVWPYPVERKLGIPLHRTPILTSYLGPCVLPPVIISENRFDRFEHETIAGLIQQLPHFKVWNLAVQPGMKQAGIFNARGLQTGARQTFLINLLLEENVLFTAIKNSVQKDIRNSGKTITIAENPLSLTDLYHFHKHTLNNKGKKLPYTLSDMQRLMDACVKNDSGMLYCAMQEGKVLAIAWNVWDTKRSYHFMSAKNPEAPNRAAAALIWHTIKRAKERGNELFDFEGSMDPGIEGFFRCFGGKRELYLVLKKNESFLWRIRELLR